MQQTSPICERLWYMEVIIHAGVFFFFKQKTAYEMRISDWSSDVCSSDLSVEHVDPCTLILQLQQRRNCHDQIKNGLSLANHATNASNQIGRASCRERVCQYV